MMKTPLPWIALLLLLGACHATPGTSSVASGGEDSLESVGTRSATTADSAAGTAVSSDREILPGSRIGKTFVGEATDTVITILGKPDYSDAAMGKAWMTWFGKKRDEHNNRTELNVFVTYQDSTMRSKTVRQIRTTSSWFVLGDSIHVYSDFRAIQKDYPSVTYTGTYKEGARTFRIFDELQKGIAFETTEVGEQVLCTAIIVHTPGKPLIDIYFPIHGDQGS